MQNVATPAVKAEELKTGADTTYLATAGDEAGEPLLLLHGTGPGAAGVRNFQPLLPSLTAYRCLMPDLIGFADSSHPDTLPAGQGPWFARRVEGVVQLLDALGLDRVHVVGHSYGARVALELLLQAPDRFRQVVLLSAGGTPVKPNLQSLSDFYQEPSETAMRTFVDAQLSQRDVPGIDDYVKGRFETAVRPEVRRSFEAAMASGERAPIYDDAALAGITHAVLAVHGKDDATIPSAAALFLTEHLPHSDLHLYAGCGHLLQFEVPDQLGALISQFVAAG
jgi:2-hydroxymuconate-semialdehyde hydrolase